MAATETETTGSAASEIQDEEPPDPEEPPVTCQRCGEEIGPDESECGACSAEIDGICR